MTEDIDLTMFKMKKTGDRESFFEVVEAQKLSFEEPSGSFNFYPPTSMNFGGYSDEEVLRYALEHPVNLYEEEEVYQGTTGDVLEAVELELACQYVEDHGITDEDSAELASKFNHELLQANKSAPTCVSHVVNDRGRQLFYANYEFEGWGYAVGPCIIKRELVREFHRHFYSKAGKYVHLMSRFMNESVDHVAKCRNEEVRWMTEGRLMTLTVGRHGRHRVWKSTLLGIRGVTQCGRQYLREVMGFNIVCREALVPGYSERSGQVWQSLMGPFKSQEVYDFVKREMVTQNDVRVPEGKRVFKGRNLMLCCETRMDFYALVRKKVKAVEDVQEWMERRYGKSYTTGVLKDIYGYVVMRMKKSEAMESQEECKDPIDGKRLMKSVVRALEAFPIGLRMNEILREVRRTWRVDSCELGYVLRTYVDEKWYVEIFNGLPKYFLRSVHERGNDYRDGGAEIRISRQSLQKERGENFHKAGSSAKSL